MGKTRKKKNAGHAEKSVRSRARLLSVELLRVTALLGIALFHSFQPWFSALVDGTLAETYPEIGFIAHPAFMAAMGLIDQLGAWGNHVFIMISGCFLLPRAIEASADGARAKEAASGDSRRRSALIFLTVALYTGIALLASQWFPDVTGLSADNLGWLAQGLQFIWIYLILVVSCPLIARLWAGCRRRQAVLAAMVAIVYGVNLYIAFVSPGSADRSLFEWRKLMSGASYALSFVIGGWLAEWAGREGQGDRASKQRMALFSLVLSVAVTAGAELFAGISGDLRLLEALSFKSTSPFACAMASAALACALCVSPGKDGEHSGAVELARYVASGALGFYALQALFSSGWHEISNALLAWAIEAGAVAFFMTGLVFSCALLFTFLGIDALGRQTLFERLGL